MVEFRQKEKNQEDQGEELHGCCRRSCKIEFNQPSYWLYSVPNLLVFQQLVTLYLGGILVRVVSEIV